MKELAQTKQNILPDWFDRVLPSQGQIKVYKRPKDQGFLEAPLHKTTHMQYKHMAQMLYHLQ